MNISGIIHAHSRYSYDADIPLADLKEVFTSSGLRFACVTEHTDELSPQDAEKFINECRELSDERFLFVPGFEMPYLGTHILLIGARSFPFDERDLQGSLRRWVADGAVAVIAHPHRNGYRIDDLMLGQCIGMEVWNSQYDGKYAPRPGALGSLRALRERKPGFLAFGGLDLHRRSHLGGPYVQLQVDALSHEQVLSRLTQGDYVLQGRTTSVSPDGTVRWPTPLGAALFGYVSLGIIGAVRLASRLAKKLGLQNNRWFKRGREMLRKNL